MASMVPTAGTTSALPKPLPSPSTSLKECFKNHREVRGLTYLLGVTTLGLIASLVVTYAYLKPQNKKADKAGKCEGGGTPVVDTAGKVTNPLKKAMKDAKGVCRCIDDIPGLNALCLATRRTPSNDTWDAYDSKTQSCVKTETQSCEQTLCDAKYCTSESVLKTLQPIHKLTVDGKCVNPTLLSVEQLCALQPNTSWNYPDCLSILPQKVIKTYDVLGTTTHINGVLSYQYEPVVPLAPGALFVRYSIKAGDGSITDTGNVVLVSEALGCSSRLTSIAGHSNNQKASTKGEEQGGCYNFEVYFTRALVPGTYTLELTVTGDYINLVSETPTSITLPLATATSEGGNPAMNPVPSAELADNYFTDEAFMNKWIVHLKSITTEASARSRSDDTFLFLPSALPRPLPVFVRTVASSKQYGAALAPPELCPLVEHTTLNAQFVVVAWAPSSDDGVQYGVTKSVGGKEQVLLGEGDTALNSMPVFVDRISVGDVCNYTVRAYHVSLGARSERVSLCVTGEPFPNNVCAQIACPADQCALPPMMWSTPTGCVWYPNDQPRSDAYCAGQYPEQLHLAAAQQNACMPVGKSYPRVVRLPIACEAPRVVACPRALPLGTTADTIDNDENFRDRLQNAQLPSKLYSSYFMCGPLQSPTTWGTSTGTCDDNDSACKSFANAGDSGSAWVEASSPEGELRFEQRNKDCS